MSIILGILKIIILLGTLVTIHELGHFLVAKACNIKVHKFAIGFGPKIISKVKGETEYAIRAIPFGGFVQMEGEDTASEDERAFNKKPVWQRMLVIVAGATVNLVFAVLLYFIVTANINMYSISVVDNIDENTIAYSSGLRNDDIIKKVNGNNTYFAVQVSDYISEASDSNVVFTVEREGKIRNINALIPEREIGYAGAAFTNESEVVYVQEGEAAYTAGLREGDKIISLNGKEDISATEIVDEIKSNANNNIELIVEREERKMNINLIPTEKTVKVFDANYKIVSNLNFFENSFYALKETQYYFSETIKAFTKLFSGRTENASVMGPIGIAGQITKTEGFVDFFYLMSAISFSLGICNLLPIPGLDGGKFLFLIIELIRRKPMKEKTELALQLAGFAIIITIAIVVTVKDVLKLF